MRQIVGLVNILKQLGKLKEMLDNLNDPALSVSSISGLVSHSILNKMHLM